MKNLRLHTLLMNPLPSVDSGSASSTVVCLHNVTLLEDFMFHSNLIYLDRNELFMYFFQHIQLQMKTFIGMKQYISILECVHSVR